MKYVCVLRAFVSYHSIEGESGDRDVFWSTMDVKVLAAGVGFNVARMVCWTKKMSHTNKKNVQQTQFFK